MKLTSNFTHLTMFVAMLLIITWFLNSLNLVDSHTRKKPDFASIEDVKKRKVEFFTYLLPIIEQENDRLSEKRQLVMELSDVYEQREQFTAAQQSRYFALQVEYELQEQDPGTVLSMLKRRVDVLPPSLVLAQAALESAWGTSRFAVEANNYFGHWCFEESCGVVPNSRNDGATHEVAKFDSVNESIRKYMHNLNTFYAYRDFRTQRASLRKENRSMDGYLLAEYLTAYSQEREKYTTKLRRLIKRNNLVQYDMSTDLLAASL
ncbi:Putative Bax protein [Pseudoalteromonas luteoviolacea B = ATCC 29581]|nr:Putative Bax protein [Pseudoalteromonas luteoviolacea B = ATCC 29581]